MSIRIELKGILDEQLNLLVKAGLYASKTEVVRDSIRHLLKELDIKNLTFELYRDGKVSTGLALELTEMDLVRFLHNCKQRGIKPMIGVETTKELIAEVNGLTND